jgi:predicted DNA-binding protein (MmcQ/YjbR family)
MTLYDLSDEQLKQLIEKNSEEIKKQLPERTQSRFVDTLDAILQATE